MVESRYSRDMIIFMLVITIVFHLSVVSGSFLVTQNVRYINLSETAEINISVRSGGNTTTGGSGANISQIVFVLPTGFSFVADSNITSTNMNYTNTSSNVIWSNGNESFTNNTEQNFRFNVSSTLAGDSTMTIQATRADGNTNSTTISLTTNFDFYGFVRNETGGNESNVNITIYRFEVGQNSPPTQVHEKGVVSNSNGSFTINSINGSATNYILKLIRYGDSGSVCISENGSVGCNATMIGTSLPPFPANIYYPPVGGNDFSLNGSTFYLQPAATLRLYAHGYNTTNTLMTQRFGYMVIDEKIGFPVDSNILQNVSNKSVVIPSGKDFSVMFLRDFSRFKPAAVCNGTTYNDSYCPAPPLTNSSLGTLSPGQVLVVNQSLSISRNSLHGCINTAVGHNNTEVNVTAIKLKMIPFSTSSGAFIPEMDGARGDINISINTQLNNSGSNGAAVIDVGINCTNSVAAYNFSVLGSASGISYFLEVYAKNTTNDNEAATDVGGNYLAGMVNVTITGNLAKNITLYKLVGDYSNSSDNKNTLNTSLYKINIQNDTGGAATTDMHVEVSIKNSNIGIGTIHYMIETLTNGTFYFPVLNNSNYAEVSIYPNDAPPSKNKINLSNSVTNITLVTIDFGAHGDKGVRQFNSSGKLEVINGSGMPIQLRFLRRGTNTVLTEMNSSSFNPLKALVAGNIDLELKVKANNVTMRFNNFDMFAAKQPPMFAVMDNNTMDSTDQLWKFGNFVPKDVYDNVTLTIPYDSTINESETYRMAVPILYTEDQANAQQLIVKWNRTRGDTSANLTDEFIAYNATRYRDYLTADGITCSKTDASAVCYMNTTGDYIVMEIPHFSGLSPNINIPATSTTSSPGGGGGAAVLGSLIYTVTPSSLENGYTKSLSVNNQLRMTFNVSSDDNSSLDEIHFLKIDKIDNGSGTVDITVNSTPQKATVSVGETKKFDVTVDNFYDLSVTLDKIEFVGSIYRAKITIKGIHEAYVPLVSDGAKESDVDDVEDIKDIFDSEGAEYENFWVFMVFMLVVIIAVVIYFMIKRKNY